LKGTKDIKEFLKKDPGRLEKILTRAKSLLFCTAAVNTTRYALDISENEPETLMQQDADINCRRCLLLEALKGTGLPVECGSGGLTKFNRSHQNLQKEHWIDAACVGMSTPILKIKGIKPLLITANGHGTRQMAGTDKFGFPIRHRSKGANPFWIYNWSKSVEC
jgi:hypothetical protein